MVNTREALARFIVSTNFDDIDPVAKSRGRDAIVDWIGVAVAGSAQPIAAAEMELLKSLDEIRPESKSFLIASLDRANAPNAAFYNGTLSHALDYDDIGHPSKAHLSSSLVAAILAVVPDDEVLSEEFLCAYVIGYEVSSMIGNILLRRRRSPGWHMTGVLGPIGAAAAVARLLNLGVEETANALGVAASCSSGLHINLGSMTKPFHAGRAAQAGIIAAMLAKNGFTSSEEVFDAPMGFFRTYSTSPAKELAEATRQAIAELGNPWELTTDYGIALKPYPSFAGTHCAIEAAQQIGKEIDVNDIDEVYVGISQVTTDPLVHPQPQTGLQGKFSMEFCVAAALIDGRVSINTFTDAKVNEPRIRRMIQRVRVAVDDRVRHNEEHGAVVQVKLCSGEVLEVLIELAKGKPSRWFTPGEVQEKFEDCVGGVLGNDVARKLYESLTAEGQSSREKVTELLSGGTRAHGV